MENQISFFDKRNSLTNEELQTIEGGFADIFRQDALLDQVASAQLTEDTFVNEPIRP